MDECREDTHLIDDQTYDNEQLKDPPPPYAEQTNRQPGYNTQYSNTQPQHQQEHTQPAPGGYQQEYTQPGGYQQQYTQPGGYQQQYTQPGGYQQQYTQPGGYQQGYGYGYQQTNGMATHPYSGNTVIIKPVQRPNLVGWSFLVCLFCFCPLGIFAICFAAEANNAADRGNYEESQSKAKVAKILIVISIVLGIGVTLFIVLAGLI